MGTEAPFLSRPIPSPEPNLIKSHKNALQNSLTNSNKTEPRDSPHNKKKTLLSLFHLKNDIGFIVEYHSEFGGSRV